MAVGSGHAFAETKFGGRLSWLCGSERNAFSAVGKSTRFLLCTCVYVFFPDDFEVDESRFGDDLF